MSGRKVGEVAKDAGWHPERVYRFERGAQVPDALDLATLARVLEQPLDFFYGVTSNAPGLRSVPPERARVK